MDSRGRREERGDREEGVQYAFVEVYIPPVLRIEEGGISTLDIPHLTKFFEKLQFKNT